MVNFYGDISPDEILAVHEPWHISYRDIKEYPELLSRVLSGEFKNVRDPNLNRAIQEIIEEKP